MRIHVQNEPDDPLFAITPAQWRAAEARAGEAPHAVSFADTEEGFRAAMRETEALVIAPGAVRGLFPAEAPRLRIIFCTSAGLDRLAPFDWLPPGVLLLNNRGAHGPKAGEYALMALLLLANRLPEIIADQHAGRWVKRHAPVLAGRRLTIVGLGDLGSAAAAQAARLGMAVTGVRARPAPHPHCARVVGPSELEAVLTESELLLLAAPLTAATRGMMTRDRLARLPRGAGVVNIGRGALLDQDALCDLLDAGHLGGAVLDVFVPEPVPPGHRLWTTRNLIMTPHVSCDDPATYNPASLDILFANLRALRAGRPAPNRFDVGRGY